MMQRPIAPTGAAPFNPGKTILLVRIIVSAIVLAISVFVVLSRIFPDDYNKWAFASIGLVVGYWLR